MAAAACFTASLHSWDCYDCVCVYMRWRSLLSLTVRRGAHQFEKWISRDGAAVWVAGAAESSSRRFVWVLRFSLTAQQWWFLKSVSGRATAPDTGSDQSRFRWFCIKVADEAKFQMHVMSLLFGLIWFFCNWTTCKQIRHILSGYFKQTHPVFSLEQLTK